MLVQRHSTGERTAPRVAAAVRRPDVLEVGRVTEHDLDTTAISALVGTDYGRTLQLSDSGGHLATGDQFISGHRAEALREHGFELVDMEGFAFAMAA